MALLKFMGVADVRVVYAGDDAGGQFSEGIPVDVQWDKTNRWTVDTTDPKYSAVSREWWEYLGSMPDIRDVSGYSRVPLNQHQKIFLGMKEGAQPTKAELRELDTLAAHTEVVLKVEELVQKDQAGAGLKKDDLLKVAKEAGVETKGTKEELFDRLLDFAEDVRQRAATADLSQALPVASGDADDAASAPQAPAAGAGGTTVGGST